MSPSNERGQPMTLREVRRRAEERMAALEIAANDPDAAFSLLSVLGDALRVGVELPATARRWLAGCELRLLEAATDEAAECARACRRSAEGAGDTAMIIVLRDRFESVRVALVRALSARGSFPGLAPGLGQLDTQLAALDDTLRARVSARDLQQALGWRGLLQPRWVLGFEAGPAGALDAIHSQASSTWEGSPPDTVVADYMTHGTRRSDIERAAATDADFGDELAQIITATLDDHSDVSLAARRWLRARQPARPRVFELSVLPGKRLAAASPGVDELDAAEDETPRWVRLGVLSPFDAEGSLRITRREVRLCVYPGEDTILRVSANEAAVTRPAAEGHWEVSLTLGRSDGLFNLDIRVSGSHGSEFSEQLQLSPESHLESAGETSRL